MYLKYSKVRDDVHEPERKNPSDAGLDVFFNPKDGEEAYREVSINKPGKFETGIKVEVPHGYVLEVKNRSSMSLRGLSVGGGIIDPGYKGEICVIIHNLCTYPIRIEAGEKIAQLILTPVVHFSTLNVPEEELYLNDVAMSERGEGGFGSTGNKKN